MVDDLRKLVRYYSMEQDYNLQPGHHAPQSAHVVWTKSISGPIAFGGQIGGSLYTANDLSNYYIGKTYNTFSTLQ